MVDPLLVRMQQLLSICVSKIACANPGRGMFADGLVDQLNVGESDAAIRPIPTFLSGLRWKPTRLLAEWNQAEAFF